MAAKGRAKRGEVATRQLQSNAEQPAPLSWRDIEVPDDDVEFVESFATKLNLLGVYVAMASHEGPEAEGHPPEVYEQGRAANRGKLRDLAKSEPQIARYLLEGLDRLANLADRARASKLTTFDPCRLCNVYGPSALHVLWVLGLRWCHWIKDEALNTDLDGWWNYMASQLHPRDRDDYERVRARAVYEVQSLPEQSLKKPNAAQRRAAQKREEAAILMASGEQQKQAARAVGRHPRTLRRWKSGK